MSLIFLGIVFSWPSSEFLIEPTSGDIVGEVISEEECRENCKSEYTKNGNICRELESKKKEKACLRETKGERNQCLSECSFIGG